MARTYTPSGAGLGSTASYQKSGTPLVVAGADTYDLSYVSKAITVAAVGGNTTISFSGDATAMTIPENSVVRFDVRVLSFTLGANSQAVVELTKIPRNSLDPDILAVTRTDLLE